jgi:hypothetical protein
MQYPVTDEVGMRAEERWEQGSDYHWMGEETSVPLKYERHPWEPDHQDFACGRDAFHTLLLHGRQTRGWKRLLVPAYYCQHVVASLLRSGLDIVPYSVDCLSRAMPSELPPLHQGDVLLIVNFFGICEPVARPELAAQGIEIIEDHTHDPWSDWAWHSTADWCVASLRKTLPLPDGAVLWSPARHAMPLQSEASHARNSASAERLAAMWLKRLYLGGGDVGKESFRPLYALTEQTLHDPGPSAMTPWSKALLHNLPLSAMRARRLTNGEVLRQALEDAGELDIITTGLSERLVPFSCVVALPARSIRDNVRKELLRERIYPAVLWPLDQPAVAGIPHAAVSLSERMLSLHCDARYGADDMIRVAASLRRAIESAAAGHTPLQPVVIHET